MSNGMFLLPLHDVISSVLQTETLVFESVSLMLFMPDGAGTLLKDDQRDELRTTADPSCPLAAPGLDPFDHEESSGTNTPVSWKTFSECLLLCVASKVSRGERRWVIVFIGSSDKRLQNSSLYDQSVLALLLWSYANA